MSAARQILKNAGALTVARGATSVLTLVTTIYLARVLEPAGYGILNWGLAFLAYFTFAADLGMGVYAMREVARSEEQAWQLPGHVLVLRLAGALVTFCLFLTIVLLLDKSALFKLTVAILGLSLPAHALELGWVYHGLQRLGVVAVRNIIGSVVTLVGVLLLVRNPEQVVLAGAIMVAAIALPNVWLLVTYSREFGRPRFSLDRKLWWAMLVPALPIAASHLLGTINTSLDQVMLGFLRTETEVGWYAADYRLLMAATIPWQIAAQAFMPSLSNALGDAETMRGYGRAFATTLFALGLPIAAGGALLAPDLLALFGADYAPAAGALVVLMGSVALTYARVIFGTALISWDRQRTYMFALAAGAALNIILNIALIPPYGIEGAATATLLSEAVVLGGAAIAYFQIVRRLHLAVFARAVLATLGGVVLPLLGTAALGAPLAAQIAATTVGYAASAWALGLIPPQALTALRAALRRQ